ncbi:MAG: hypothetical protein QOF11_588 [Chloroflexota bacterium]|jgi:hypothetical protein|nr:hypothetical protein [Chloroflexota bacterium]
MAESNRGGLRTAIDEWRAFVAPRYRRFLGIGVGQAAVSALAGDGLTIPLLLTLGAHPAVATVIGVLPFAFSSAQLLVPRLLRRFDGNLRGLTLVILLVGETRGFILAGFAFLAWAGILPRPAAIVAIGLVMTMAGAATTIGGANLLAWYGAILPDPERRFVAPRVMGVNLGLGAFLLLPVALLVQALESRIGILVYALVFVAAGVAGIAELLVIRRLPRPGRVLVAAPRTAAGGAAGANGAAGGSGAGGGGVPSPPGPAVRELDRFLRVVTVAAFGAGFGPYLSIYAISVLGLPPAFAILLSALSSAAALVSATIVGGLLGRGSSSRFLRLSFLLRGGSMIFGLLAWPQNPLAWLVLCVVAIVASAGAAAGTLAANERLMRLSPGPEVIHAQGRFVSGTALGITAGQLANAVILAVLPLGYPTFAILFVVSGLTRFVTAIQADVSASWSSTTAAYRVDELRGPEPPGDPTDER